MSSDCEPFETSNRPREGLPLISLVVDCVRNQLKTNSKLTAIVLLKWIAAAQLQSISYHYLMNITLQLNSGMTDDALFNSSVGGDQEGDAG